LNIYDANVKYCVYVLCYFGAINEYLHFVLVVYWSVSTLVI